MKSSEVKAVLLNCSIKYDKKQSHTQRLLNRIGGIWDAEGVDVEMLHVLDYDIAFGMEKDLTDHGREKDDWPKIQAKIMAADMLVLGTPIWLGVKSSVATLAIERMYASSGDRNEKGQYLYYGKVGGCAITGNEDGAKACAMDMLYGLSHIGYTIPPQADCAWLGEAGPGPSYGDVEYAGQTLDTPAGYDNDFTNRNATIMAWNMLHMARLLKSADGLPTEGNIADNWRDVTNAKAQNPNREW